MRMNGRFLASVRLVGMALALVAVSCSDRDYTQVCPGPGCPGYDGTDAGGGSGIDDPCELSFTAPANPDGGDLTLSGTDDADGEQCGSQFTLGVTLASNANTVTLFVNDTPLSPQPVSASTSVFQAGLGNRGATPNELRALATMADGRTCETVWTGNIFVDCAGPSCTIESPLANAGGYLNSSQDADPAEAGFQTEIVVSTEAEHEGESIRLSLDGAFNVVDDELVGVNAGSGVATFGDLTLTEGARTAQAECRDAFGAVTLSPLVEWTVDTQACSLSIDAVAGGADPITLADDTNNNAADGFQVPLSGQIVGADCRVVRAGSCSSSPLPDVDLGGPPAAGSFSGAVTLNATTASVNVCAEVEDLAGNVSAPSQVTVNVRSDAPAVAITAPAADAQFNLATTCDTSVEVTCSENGADVELLVDAALAGTQPCVAGGAIFPITLATKNDGAPTALAVRQTANGLTSAPATINVQADCEAPVLSVLVPACGSPLLLNSDDTVPGTAGLQMDVVVQNGGAPEVTLTATGIPPVVATGDALSTTFVAATLGSAAGAITLDACATDAQGNLGCAQSCPFTIAVDPAIAITNPLNNAILGPTTVDCDGVAAGLQVTVQGTSDAPENSDVVVTLGAGAPQTVDVIAGAFTACVAAPEGDDQTLTAAVTNTTTTLVGTDSIVVTVDTTPSGSVAAPGYAAVGRREGTGTLTWTSVLDADGDALAAYRLRCAATDIVDEASWATATNIPVAIVPSATAGTQETFPLTGTLAGSTRFCVVRGEDGAGQLSPFNPIAADSVAISGHAFLTQEYTVLDDGNVAAAVNNVSIEPLGDINGDTIDDFIAGAVNRRGQVFFGNQGIDAIATAIAPDLEILATGFAAASGFAAEVSGLGDINGDLRPDFAVSARGPGFNTVYIFFGRAANNPWPTGPAAGDNDIDMASGPCPADVCVVGTAVSGFFGWDVHAADFDGSGAGTNDLVIAARTANTNGRVYVLLGGGQFDVPTGTILSIPADAGATIGEPDGFIIDAPALRTNFGVSTTAVSDASGPDDLIIGANTSTTAAVFFVAGQAYTLAAGSGLVAAAAPVEVDTGAANDFGNPVRSLGAFDASGLGAFVVGHNFAAFGAGRVFLRDATGFNDDTPALLLEFTNAGLDDNYGLFIANGDHPSLGLLGDLNKDGLGELLIGADDDGSASPAVSSGQLFYGRVPAVGRARAAADFAYASTRGQVVPNFVGDINNDTFNDLAILDSGFGANVVFLLY